MCAAITAREAGADVLVLEHAGPDMRGGNSRHTRNVRAMHRVPTAGLVDEYTSEDYWQDLHRVTEGHTDEPLARLMIEHSEDLLDWLQRIGVRFQPALSGTLNLSHSNAFFLGGGKALVNAQHAYARNIGVHVCYHAEVIGLAMDGPVCRGAHVRTPEGDAEVTARAAIVASGGFQANFDWMRKAWGPGADNFLIRGTPFNTGTVLKDLIDQGADTVGEADQCHAVAIDARAPKFDGGIVSRLDCVCFSIVVNQRGERFYDEGEDFWPKRYAIWGRLVAAQPEQIAYAIIDAKVTNKFMPSVFPAIEAPTVESLAVQIDVDPERLRTTIDDFNAAVRPGNYDSDRLDGCRTEGLEPAKSNWALRLDEAPYQAYPLRPGITFTYLGLKVDAEARVHFDGRPSPNLFAAGEVMAGNILGRGYCAGTGMTIGGVFGRIAGREAACRT